MEDLVEHQEAFDRVQQELDEEYQRGGSTTSTTQQNGTKQDGERKHLTEHGYEDGTNITDVQEPRSNNRQDTAPVTPHNHNALATRQTEITSEFHPQKNTDPTDLTNPLKHLSQSPSENINTPNRSPNTPPPKKMSSTPSISSVIRTRFQPIRRHTCALIPR